MMYDAMTCFVQMRGEASLAKLMHEDLWPTKPKRQKFGRPDNRKGIKTEHVIELIERVKQFEGIFSIYGVVDRLSIRRAQADYLINVLLEEGEVRRLPKVCGEGKFEYKLVG